MEDHAGRICGQEEVGADGVQGEPSGGGPERPEEVADACGPRWNVGGHTVEAEGDTAVVRVHDEETVASCSRLNHGVCLRRRGKEQDSEGQSHRGSAEPL